MTRSRRILTTLTLTVLALSLSGCSYNRLVSLREAIDGAWAQVYNGVDLELGRCRGGRLGQRPNAQLPQAGADRQSDERTPILALLTSPARAAHGGSR